MNIQKKIVPLFTILVAILVLGVGYTIVKMQEKNSAKVIDTIIATTQTYSGQFYTFSYPLDWIVGRENPQLGLVIMYPDSKGSEVISKTISTTDKITVAIVDGHLDTIGTQQVILNGQVWYVKSYAGKLDGGTENGLSYCTNITSSKYIEITSGISNKTFIEALATSIKFISLSSTTTSD